MDTVLLHGRVEGYVQMPGRLADHLFAGPGRFRHKDEQVAFHRGHASHAKAGFLFVRRDVFFFSRLPGSGMLLLGLYAQFLKHPLFDADLAFAAHLVCPAGRFDVHTEQTRCFHDGYPQGNLPASPRWLKNNHG